MDNLKKVGLTALAGSLAAVSANAAEMSVSGATLLTYTSEDTTEVTGNPFGMKTNLGFTASGDVNGYTVSYMQTSVDQFAGMSSARLSIDMGDMGTLAFDQGSGSGLKTIDDKTPTAAEEIWDGLDGTTVGGLVGAAGNTGVLLVISRMILKMMSEVAKPALAGLWPNQNGMNVVLDLGANIECNEENLIDFAELGSALYKSLFNDKPKLSLLNIGSE